MTHLPEETKFCPRCQTLRAATEFHKRGNMKDGLSFYCKECYYLIHVKRTYNVSPEAYGQMLESQGHLCGLCEEPFTNRPIVDHDHGCCPGGKSCGRCVRRLLCNRCNTLLGYLETRPEMVAKANSYIKEFQP